MSNWVPPVVAIPVPSLTITRVGEVLESIDRPPSKFALFDAAKETEERSKFASENVMAILPFGGNGCVGVN